MVSTAGGTVTVTKAEAQVLAMLDRGPCELGRRTETVMNPRTGHISLVARRPTKALAKAGLVYIDLGAVARLTPLGRKALNQ